MQPKISPRLAISVFNAEEVRAAISGGADLIDCEDPRAAIGMFEPRVVTDIAYAVRQSSPVATPTSANIGVPLVVKKGANPGQAMARSLQEILAKAAQEALGLAAAMDVGDARPNVVKFSVDGLAAKDIASFVTAVKAAVRNSRQYQNHRVVASCLELNRHAWAERRRDRGVVSQLLCLGEFSFDAEGDIDITEHLDLRCVQDIMRSYPDQSRVRLLEPSDPVELGLPERLEDRIKALVLMLSKAGADGILIDTPIQAKVANICLLAEDRPQVGQASPALPLIGTMTLEQLSTFAAYCAYMSVECWLAGSIQPDHAEQLVTIPDLDVVMCRGAASEVLHNPFGDDAGANRAERRITAQRVRELANRVKGGA